MAESVGADRRKFRARWWVANAAGFTVAHVAYSLVGHGFTGSHGEELTTAQYLAHTLGLIATAVIIFALQRRALANHLRVGGTRMGVATAVFVAAFWLGAETIGPPADWILGFTVLGTACWIGSPSLTRLRYWWTTLSVVAFWGGIAAAAGVMFVLIRTGVFFPDSETLLNHTIFWVILGGVTGAAGSFFSSWPLSWIVMSPGATQ